MASQIIPLPFVLLGKCGKRKNYKNLKKSDNKHLGEAVFTWFKNIRLNIIPVNEIIIKEKALSLAKSFELTDFRASDGWLDKWKQRNNATFKGVSAEENAVTQK